MRSPIPVSLHPGYALVRFLPGAALCLLFAVVGRASEPTARHLFLAPAFLAESHGVALRVNPAERREAVVLADKPWEKLLLRFFLTVLDEAGNTLPGFGWDAAVPCT